MKTLYLTRGSNIVIDDETKSANRIQTSRQGIDYIFMIKEPMHVVYGHGENHEEADAEPGDIVITFYPEYFKKQMIVIKNNVDWYQNLLNYEIEQQKEKERWAAQKESGDAIAIHRADNKESKN